jgi:RNA recognition motif-containing protein
MSKLFVGNLDYSVTDEVLEKHFAEHGKVVSARVITDRETNRSRGFGFVEYEDSETAKKAKEALQDSELNGRDINIDDAKPSQR